MPTLKIVGKGSVVPLMTMLEFLLQSPEIKEFTKVSNTHHHIQLAIYADDIGITNPIGKARSKHKLWVMYFQILNIPVKYRVRTSSIFPLVFTFSKLTKNFIYFSSLLKDFKKTIQLLYTGVKISIAGKLMTVTAEVLYFSGDSLAANSIGGFKEGFSQKTVRCCRRCNSTRAEMIEFTTHEECLIRNLPEHVIRLNELNSGLSKTDRTKWSRNYGIVNFSILSDIPNFDVTKQLLFDPMHDLLEGVVPLHLELFLLYCIPEKFPLADLNQWLQSYKYPYGIEKPGIILPSLKIRGQFGSGQILTLSRVLCFYLLRFMDLSDPHLSCLVKLIQIVQLCMFPLITDIYIKDLRVCIQAHHCSFLQLYSNSFIPKLHFLVHYPSQASQFGSLRGHLCLAFERKHQVIKNFRHFNFKNIPYSACKAMIVNTTGLFFNSFGERRCDVYGEVDQLKFKDGLISSAVINGIFYKQGDIVSDTNENKLEFYKILEILTENEKRIFKAQKLIIKSYSAYITAEISSGIKYIEPDSLLFPWCVLQLCSDDTNKILLFPTAIPNLNFL
ncbi:uncharacterized protein LOC136094789 [Hydra vulgaris]|uniref:uncharacterized protein LOC136094789 n=1 Tax=Hydra vulgaris TaxID=6087 RepID=UPI0032EA1D77